MAKILNEYLSCNSCITICVLFMILLCVGDVQRTSGSAWMSLGAHTLRTRLVNITNITSVACNGRCWRTLFSFQLHYLNSNRDLFLSF